MSWKTLETRPVRLEPMVTCSHPRRVPTTSMVRSTVRRSRGATVTGTTRTAAGAFDDGCASAGAHPERPAAAITARLAPRTKQQYRLIALFHPLIRLAIIEALEQIVEQSL